MYVCICIMYVWNVWWNQQNAWILFRYIFGNPHFFSTCDTWKLGSIQSCHVIATPAGVSANPEPNTVYWYPVYIYTGKRNDKPVGHFHLSSSSWYGPLPSFGRDHEPRRRPPTLPHGIQRVVVVVVSIIICCPKPKSDKNIYCACTSVRIRSDASKIIIPPFKIIIIIVNKYWNGHNNTDSTRRGGGGEEGEGRMAMIFSVAVTIMIIIIIIIMTTMMIVFIS